jgi:hypothetical protein
MDVLNPLQREISDKKRGRRARVSFADDDDVAGSKQLLDNEPSGEFGKLHPRRSRRERHSATDLRWIYSAADGLGSSPSQPKDSEAEIESETERHHEPPAKKRRKGRPSLTEVSIAEAQNQNPVADARRNAGRPSTTSDKTRSPEHLSQLRKTQRASNSGAAGSSLAIEPSSSFQRVVKPARRRRSSVGPENLKQRRIGHVSAQSQPSDDEDASVPNTEAPKHRSLVSRAHTVSRAEIAKKWEPLDSASIAMVDSIVRDAERSVLVRVPERNNKRELSELAMKAVSRRLRSKLAKGMPFPPALSKVVPSSGVAGRKISAHGAARGSTGSHEGELSFEGTIDDIQRLQLLLDPLQHSLILLQREKEREEAALENDYDVLHDLENNARAEARDWQQRAKKAHALAPELRSEAKGDPADGLELPSGVPVGPALVFTVCFSQSLLQTGVEIADKAGQNDGDENLRVLSQQVASHMDSMANNLKHVDSIVEGITAASAALRGVLTQNLRQTQFEDLLLG